MRPLIALGGLSLSFASLTLGYRYCRHRDYSFKNFPFFQRDGVKCEEGAESTLRMVQVFFRHGRRTPLLEKFQLEGIEWPKQWIEEDLPETMFDYTIVSAMPYEMVVPSSLDKYVDKMGPLPGGALRGKLTTFGQLDAFGLGKRLGKKYIEEESLVSSDFDNSKIRVYSTNLSRTIISARCLLAGMFNQSPPEPAQIQTRPNELEYYFPNFTYCLAYRDFYENDKTKSEHLEQFVKDKAEVAAMLKKDPSELPSVKDLWEEINCLKLHGFVLPSAYDFAYEKISDSATKLFAFRAFHTRSTALRYGVGLLLDDIAYSIKDFETKKSSHAIHLNSVHDSTIMGLLTSLNAFDDKWPDVSSYLAIEYHQINNNPFVRVVYNDKVIPLGSEKAEFLPLNSFYSLIKPNRLKDVDYVQVCCFNPM